MARGFADKSAARQWVWDRLSAESLARFPFPPHGRIPNFAGAEVAAARLLDIEPWKSATAVKVNPDSPQPPLRAEALRPGANGFRTHRRRRQVDRTGHQREAQVTSPTRPWHIDPPWTIHPCRYQRFPRMCDGEVDEQ